MVRPYRLLYQYVLKEATFKLEYSGFISLEQ